jgi:hypothetical protein
MVIFVWYDLIVHDRLQGHGADLWAGQFTAPGSVAETNGKYILVGYRYILGYNLHDKFGASRKCWHDMTSSGKKIGYQADFKIVEKNEKLRTQKVISW